MQDADRDAVEEAVERVPRAQGRHADGLPFGLGGDQSLEGVGFCGRMRSIGVDVGGEEGDRPLIVDAVVALRPAIFVCAT